MYSASFFLILSHATNEVLEAKAETDDALLKTDAPLKTDPVLNLTDSANVQPPSESGNCDGYILIKAIFDEGSLILERRCESCLMESPYQILLFYYFLELFFVRCSCLSSKPLLFVYR